MNVAKMNLRKADLQNAMRRMQDAMDNVAFLNNVRNDVEKGHSVALVADDDTRELPKMLIVDKTNKKAVLKLIRGLVRQNGEDIARECALITRNAELLAKAMDE